MSYAGRVCAEVSSIVQTQVLDKPINFTPEEVVAVRAVRRALAAWGVPKGSLGELEMIVFTLNSKCQVDEALNRYRTYLKDLLDEFDLTADDIWRDDVDARRELESQWPGLCVAGTDREGRQIMWLSAGLAAATDKQDCHIRACCRYFYAVHADLQTLRKGVTLVIDATNKNVGLARKLQEIWQKNLPLRPQKIYILGTNPLMRPVINAFVAFAALFVKGKVISRIKHVDLETLTRILGPAALPASHGGSASRPVDQWVRERINDFPLMNLPEPAQSFFSPPDSPRARTEADASARDILASDFPPSMDL